MGARPLPEAPARARVQSCCQRRHLARKASAASCARSALSARASRPVWAGAVSQNSATSPVAISTTSTWSARSGLASRPGARPPLRTSSSYSRLALTPPPLRRVVQPRGDRAQPGALDDGGGMHLARGGGDQDAVALRQVAAARERLPESGERERDRAADLLRVGGRQQRELRVGGERVGPADRLQLVTAGARLDLLA